MERGLVITLPASDLVTNYLATFSKGILSVCLEKNVKLRKLHNEFANKTEFEKTLKKLNYQLIVFNGHGNVDCITGHKNIPIIKLGENHDLLSDRITYARSCYAAQGVGVQSMKNNKCGCFIGYIFPFMFLNDVNWSGNPSRDNVAKLFLESSNLVPIGLLKGHTALESSENCKKSMLKTIKKTIFSEDKDSQIIAETMWNNYEAQIVLGNKEARLVD